MVTVFFGTIAANAYNVLHYKGRLMARSYCGSYDPYDSDRVAQHFLVYSEVHMEANSMQAVMPGYEAKVVADCFPRNSLKLDEICEFEFGKLGMEK